MLLSQQIMEKTNITSSQTADSSLAVIIIL